jgi:hypothetical protein
VKVKKRVETYTTPHAWTWTLVTFLERILLPRWHTRVVANTGLHLMPPSNAITDNRGLSYQCEPNRAVFMGFSASMLAFVWAGLRLTLGLAILKVR